MIIFNSVFVAFWVISKESMIYKIIMINASIICYKLISKFTGEIITTTQTVSPNTYHFLTSSHSLFIFALRYCSSLKTVQF